MAGGIASDWIGVGRMNPRSLMPRRRFGWSLRCANGTYATRSSERGAGIVSSGIGAAMNNRRAASPIHLAYRADRATRALSVAIPVFAYIWRYSLEISTNATRALQAIHDLRRAPRRGASCRSWSHAPCVPTRISSSVHRRMR